jgi:hypothetical protein
VLPKGRPVYLTLEKDPSAKDDRLQLIKSRFSHKVVFIRIKASSARGKEAAAAYTIGKYPAAVLVDKDGAVVAKQQGALTSVEMEQALKGLAR